MAKKAEGQHVMITLPPVTEAIGKAAEQVDAHPPDSLRGNVGEGGHRRGLQRIERGPFVNEADFKAPWRRVAAQFHLPPLPPVGVIDDVDDRLLQGQFETLDLGLVQAGAQGVSFHENPKGFQIRKGGRKADA
jgi:hypothetical protein